MGRFLKITIYIIQSTENYSGEILNLCHPGKFIESKQKPCTTTVKSKLNTSQAISMYTIFKNPNSNFASI